jgi:hypothetical protein
MLKRFLAATAIAVAALIITSSPAAAQTAPPPDCSTCCLCDYDEWVCGGMICWEFGCFTEQYENGYEDCETYVSGGTAYCNNLGDMCPGERAYVPDGAIEGVPGLDLQLPCAQEPARPVGVSETASVDADRKGEHVSRARARSIAQLVH